MGISKFEIGTSYAGLTKLDALTTRVPDPKTEYRPYAKTALLGDGSRRGLGYPVVIWNFGLLTQAQRDQLRSYCSSGPSANVFIRTRTDESDESEDIVYAAYQAVMHWPEQEDYDTTRRLDFRLEFRAMVLQEEA